MNACVIVPTYNESKNIASIVKKLKGYNLEVVVVDDGSQDNTAKVAENYGAKVIKNAYNLGKGASLIKGFNYAIKNNFDIVITMDGDGQHLPEEVLNFIQKAKESSACIFIGNRMLNTKDMPFLRKLTNLIMSLFISLIVKQYIPDTQCGFRLIKRELLEKLKLDTRHYETESEIIIKAKQLGYKIEVVPIKCIYRKLKSQIHPFLDTLRFIRFIMRHYIRF
ncbi:MAG: glycosyltransferase family 2 protein [Candidatus Omnitrophica bacterium]|nr:glycosyltransferase family 2 protein [Candidatus Omnitrophota bacterium]